MSKHQACRQCNSGFVGPDGDIGQNLCPDCVIEMFGGRDEMIESQAATITQLEADKAELVGLVKAIEWSAGDEYDDFGEATPDTCPSCRGEHRTDDRGERNGHFPDCKLKDLIAKHTPAPQPDHSAAVEGGAG